MKNVAQIAHDQTIAWVKEHEKALSHFTLFGSGTTGGPIGDETGLEITRLKSGHSASTRKLIR